MTQIIAQIFCVNPRDLREINLLFLRTIHQNDRRLQILRLADRERIFCQLLQQPHPVFRTLDLSLTPAIPPEEYLFIFFFKDQKIEINTRVDVVVLVSYRLPFGQQQHNDLIPALGFDVDGGDHG